MLFIFNRYVIYAVIKTAKAMPLRRFFLKMLERQRKKKQSFSKIFPYDQEHFRERLVFSLTKHVFMVFISLGVYIDEKLMTEKWNCKLLSETHGQLNFLQ